MSLIEAKSNFKEIVSEFFYKLAMLGVVISFFASPFLKFINPLLLLTLGVGIGFILYDTRTSLFGTYIKEKTKLEKLMLKFIISVSLLFMALAIADGFISYNYMEEECSRLQIGMTSKNVDFDKFATAFSAASCRFKAFPEFYMRDEQSKNISYEIKTVPFGFI